MAADADARERARGRTAADSGADSRRTAAGSPAAPDGRGAGAADRSNLLAPRWLLGHFLALLLVVLFVTLGSWQLSRLEERLGENRLIEARMEAAPEPLTELLSRYDGRLEEAQYRTAVAQGEYVSDHELLLRSRSRSGEPGYHVLTPLVLEGGRAVLVDRGWVPFRMDTPPVAQAEPPSGPVEVTGMVLLEQDPPGGWSAAFAPSDPAEGVLQRAFYVDADRLSAQIPYELLPVYLELRGQEPAQEELPLAPPLPDLDQGSHRSYALQWFSFAIIGIVGYILLLAKTARGGQRG